MLGSGHAKKALPSLQAWKRGHCTRIFAASVDEDEEESHFTRFDHRPISCGRMCHASAHTRDHAVSVRAQRDRIVCVGKPLCSTQNHMFNSRFGSLAVPVHKICDNGDHQHIHADVSTDGALAEHEGMTKDGEAITCKDADHNLSWNRKVSFHVQRQQVTHAIFVYNRMLQEGCIPDKSTYILLLSTRCSSSLMLRLAIQVHSLVSSLEKDIQSDIILTNIFISLYGRCDCLEWSKILFCSLDERSVVSWNSMISVYVQKGQGQLALNLVDQMKQEGMLGNTITFVSTLHACSSESALRFGMHLHASIAAQKATADVYLNTALVSMYAKCMCVEKAERLFEEMPNRNVVSWNTMISAYAQHGQGKRVIALFHQLQKVALAPTIATFMSIISTFSNQLDLPKAKQIHALVVGEIFDSYISIGTALIDMYRRCGSVSSAQSVFDAMRDHDQGSWNAMVATFVQSNKVDEVFQLFAHMQLQGVVPNKATYSIILSACSHETVLLEGMRLHALIINSNLQKDLLVGNTLVSMYGKCGVLDRAQRVFDSMDERNTVSWNAMLDAHALHGKSHDLFQLFERMRKDQVAPDKMTFTSMLSICSRLGLVDQACDFLISMTRDFGLAPTRDHFNCVIDLLARVGKLDEAEALLNNMPISYCAVSMRTLLGACRWQADIKRGERAAKQIILLDPRSTSPYTILSGLYGVTGEEG